MNRESSEFASSFESHHEQNSLIHLFLFVCLMKEMLKELFSESNNDTHKKKDSRRKLGLINMKRTGHTPV